MISALLGLAKLVLSFKLTWLVLGVVLHIPLAKGWKWLVAKVKAKFPTAHL